MKKIAIVIQRYGLEVNGGAEFYVRLLAKQLSKNYHIEVLTTCAMDYIRWENIYEVGTTIVDDIRVLRFKVDKPRNTKKFIWINRIVNKNWLRTQNLEEKWIDEQGPKSTELINYIQGHKEKYDAFIFVTYLYYHTVKGLPGVSNKSILIPTAHDEPPIYFDIYKKIFQIPKAIVYLTEEEKDFVQSMFNNQSIPTKVMAVGIDPPTSELQITHSENSSYIVYVGRVDVQKGCKQMIDYFLEYKKKSSNIKLILLGKVAIDIPQDPSIETLGFVSEEKKWEYIKGAECLILPSKYESLSLSVLEAMSVGVPVVVNGECKVLKGHCTKSDAGMWYNNRNEFINILDKLHGDANIRKNMGIKGIRYIQENYTWEKIEEGFREIIGLVTEGD